MHVIEGGVCAVPGVRAFGLKEGKEGLAIIVGGGHAAGVFTSNNVKAAPILVTQEYLTRASQVSAVAINSGSANAFTGQQGVEDARWVAALLARRLDLETTSVAVASTGVIGQPLDRAKIETQMEAVLSKLSDAPEGSLAAARAIMTTDSAPKQVAVEMSGIRIGGISKGAGMIEPDLCTMLAFIYTDAPLAADVLKGCLVRAVNLSFNMAVVDGDTSTNDCVLLVSTGASSADVDLAQFQEALNSVCITLAKMIVKDGEGATKLMEVTVVGAREQNDAIKAAKAVVRSPLVKTAIFGADPNWGRIVAAVGYSEAYIEPDMLSLKLSSQTVPTVTLIAGGHVCDHLRDSEEGALRAIMASSEIEITLDLGVGCEVATAWGCDLTYDYVRINAEYTT
ncbi:MAG: bifunctional glutamate N-acetyltransferase/amino-acid acetyltransferase ArgJ [Halobacteriota archaeon]